MKTTAEGVETERQRTIAASLGCTEMQGNLFSAALPADEIAELLALHAAFAMLNEGVKLILKPP